MNHGNQDALIRARLFEKGLRDALAGMDLELSISKSYDPFCGGHVIVCDARKTYNGKRISTRFVASCEVLDSLHEVYSYAKDTGFKIAMRILVEICEAQPQEITISLKDLDKARAMDRKREPSSRDMDPLWKLKP